MKIILCVAVLIAAAAAAPGTWDQTGITLEHTWPHARPTWVDFTKTVDRRFQASANEFFPNLDDFTKTVDRGFQATANEIFPKSEEELAKEAVNNLEEDALDAFKDFISGGGDCDSDSDCNAVVGYCYRHPISKYELVSIEHFLPSR